MSRELVRRIRMFMNRKSHWPLLLLWIVICVGGLPGLANNNVAGKAVPVKPVANQLSPQEQALFDAVKAGDSEKVKKLIADGVDVNCHYADGFSPIHVAILRDDADMISFLGTVSNNLDPTILLTAEKRVLVLDRCKRKNIFTSLRVSYPLVQVASVWGSARCTTLLLRIIPKDSWAQALTLTYPWSKINVQKPYVQKQGCWDYYGRIGYTEALWYPFYVDLLRSVARKHGLGDLHPRTGGYLQILEWVNKQAPEIFIPGDRFHLTEKKINGIAGAILTQMDDPANDTETVNKLKGALDIIMRRGATQDAIMDMVRGTTNLPLMKALVHGGYDPALAFRKWIHASGLSKCGPNYAIAHSRPLNWMDLSVKINGIYWLLNQGVQVPDDIMLDVVGDKGMVNFMASLGATISPEDKKGQSLLIWACRQAMSGGMPTEGQIKFIQYLVDFGINPDIEDKFGWRPIDYLFCQSRPKPIIALLRHGADISHTEKMFSYSVISYLIEEYTDLAAQFGRYHFTSPFNWDQGTRPLSWSFGSMTRHHFQWRETPLLPFLQLLIKNGADVNFVSNNGLTPLMEAAMIGRMDAVVLLVEKGGDIGTKARKPTTGRYPGIWTGKTAIELTAKGHPEIRDYLMQMERKKEKAR